MAEEISSTFVRSDRFGPERFLFRPIGPVERAPDFGSGARRLPPRTLFSKNVDLVPARELRARALSELAREYEELRRKMLYLRHYQGDADEIIPSLWALRGSSRRSDPDPDPSEGGEPTSGDPVVPTPGDDNPPFTP